MRADADKAAKLRDIVYRLRIVTDWLGEAADGVDCGVPNASEVDDIAQEYQHWYTGHCRDLERVRGRRGLEAGEGAG